MNADTDSCYNAAVTPYIKQAFGSGSDFLIKFQSPIPPVAALFAGIAFGIALSALPVFSKVGTHLNNQQQHYGNALAHAAARESVEAAFRQDLISLRAILESIVANEGVIQAAVYSVEGRILVQADKHANTHAGTHTSPNLKGTVYQATIALQDSVAGVVTITLAPMRPLDTLISLEFYLAIMFGCLIGAIILMVKNNSLRFVAPRVRPHQTASGETRSSESVPEDTQEPPLEETSSRSDEPETADARPIETAYAALCVKNVATLQQQLNGETFRRTFTQLERKLQHIGKLYGSSDCQWQRDRYILIFQNSSAEQALFQATCASRLMLDLAGITNRIPLDLSAQVSFQQDNTLNDDMPFVGLAIHEHGNAYELLADKISFLDISEEDESRRLISRFEPAYENLLQSQTAQLSTELRCQ